VTVTEARMCGIDTPARISFGSQGLNLESRPRASDQAVEPTLRCVLNDANLATGTYGLAGRIAAHGTPAEFGRSAEGELKIHAAGGRIYGLKVAKQLLNVVSVATGSLGSLGDITKAGLPYDTIDVTGDVRGGTLVLTNAVFHGPFMKTVGEGSIDLVEGTVDITLLVAPLKSVDKVVSWIPVIGGVLGGNLVSIPVKVSGKLNDPKVVPMDPAAVGSSMLRLMTRTLERPVKAVKPWFSSKEKKW
jgi:hypothetical protein